MINPGKVLLMRGVDAKVPEALDWHRFEDHLERLQRTRIEEGAVIPSTSPSGSNRGKIGRGNEPPAAKLTGAGMKVLKLPYRYRNTTTLTETMIEGARRTVSPGGIG
jgi:hypothetical protein